MIVLNDPGEPWAGPPRPASKVSIFDGRFQSTGKSFARAAMAGFSPRASASRMMVEAVMSYWSAASFMAWCISVVRATVVCSGKRLSRRRWACSSVRLPFRWVKD